jgi:putative methionine-R-sulfoxide reductase with GAF domain
MHRIQVRPYDKLVQRLTSQGSAAQRMRTFIDALWELLHPTGVSWAGFYLDQPNEPDDRRLLLGPCRDKPACSPIGLHGVCGQALRFGTTRIVHDVIELGSSYVACDPRDKSEIVIPLEDERGHISAVLDLDSHEIGAFDDADDEGLRRALIAAGFHPTG